jgi:hypothetical protein
MALDKGGFQRALRGRVGIPVETLDFIENAQEASS